MTDRSMEQRFRDLESHADLPEVQELIRQEIRKGTIRVLPNRNGGIRIIPVGSPERKEPTGRNALAARSLKSGNPAAHTVFQDRASRR